MLLLAFDSIRKIMLVFAAAALMAVGAASASAQDDPPVQAGRLSSVSGWVSIQPAGADDWGQAIANLPLGPGDRIFTDSDGRAEIQVGQSYLRIGPNADVTLVATSPYGIWYGVAQGSAHLHVLGLWPGQSVHVNTPSGSASLARPGELRVDVFSEDDAAVFTSLSSGIFISGAGGYGQDLESGQTLELAGSNPVDPQWLTAADPDNLDGWSETRDRQILHSASYRYMSAEIPGAEELDGNGIWLPGTEFGPIWFPNVAAGWTPYHYGHWVNHAPWGWVWVEDESWGYAPFHYGRWVSVAGRWAWVPGPAASHPVWSPALVVFAGGINVGGSGVSAWFPLGPGEPYRPWYPCSPRYMDQINISNMTEGPHVHILPTYASYDFGRASFANHAIGVSAMRHDDFAAGRPVHQSSVAIDIHVFDHITIIERPEPPVPARPVAYGPPPSHPIPVRMERPVLMNEQGKMMAAKPGAQAMEPPVKAAPPVRALPGRTAVAPPPGATKPPAPAPVAKPAPVAPPASQPHAAPAAAQPSTVTSQRPLMTAPAAPPARPQPPVPAAAPASKPVVAAPVAAPAGKPATPPAAKTPAPAAAPTAKPVVAAPVAAPAGKPTTPPAVKAPAPVPATPGAAPDKGKKDDKKKPAKDEKPA